MVIIGYSGHAYVVCGILAAAGKPVSFYCDVEEKDKNPFNLKYIGSESHPEAIAMMKDTGVFIAIGDNAIRRKIANQLADHCKPVNAIHPTAVIDPSADIGESGIMIAAGVCINPLAVIHEGAICNTASVIEHECVLGAYSHVGPGAVICGNVIIGEGSFVGAGAIIRQNITIGKNAMIGMGAVVVKNVADNEVVVGNPSRKLIKIN
jgi:sugar O-acyltransferase (sialic acid O-acetyltransferase NeuD family)